MPSELITNETFPCPLAVLATENSNCMSTLCPAIKLPRLILSLVKVNQSGLFSTVITALLMVSTLILLSVKTI